MTENCRGEGQYHSYEIGQELPSAFHCMKKKNGFLLIFYSVNKTKLFRSQVSSVAFTHTKASNFRRPLQSLLLRYTAENSQVT